MAAEVYNVLFLCTGNSARSIMAEAILNHLGRGKFRASSAGSNPRGALHPMTVQVLTEMSYDVSRLRSKSWTEFAAQGSPPLDFVFTVCDRVAGEVCPAWPGQPITAHWSFADPAAATGSEAIRYRAFLETQRQISTRIRLFLSLPFEKLDHLSLQRQVRTLGQSERESIDQH